MDNHGIGADHVALKKAHRHYEKELFVAYPTNAATELGYITVTFAEFLNH